VVIVTGGDSGIGRSVAVMMAKEKAKAVAIVYLPKEQQVRCLFSVYAKGCFGWWSVLGT